MVRLRLRNRRPASDAVVEPASPDHDDLAPDLPPTTADRDRGSAGDTSAAAPAAGDAPEARAAVATAEEPAEEAAEEPAEEPPEEPAEEPDGASGPTPHEVAPVTGRPARRRLRDATPLLLLRAAHPTQALLTALGLAAAAGLQGRPTREVGAVLATVLVGQAVLGWHNDLVDRDRDARHAVPGKPVADGRLEGGTVGFAMACGVLLVVPLSVTTGVVAAMAYLASLVVAGLGNVVLRRGVLSWLPWAVSFGLYPAYLSYGGWGGDALGPPPTVLMTVLAAALGVGVHLFRALWGLVPDHEDGWTYLPLRLGRRLGASRLLALTTVYCVLVVAGIAFAGAYDGLSQPA